MEEYDNLYQSHELFIVYKTTNGVTYKDFQVAQHTKNYEAWVRSSTMAGK